MVGLLARRILSGRGEGSRSPELGEGQETWVCSVYVKNSLLGVTLSKSFCSQTSVSFPLRVLFEALSSSKGVALNL